ncbi:MAG: 4'-phosphopantetheinyl transferase superfamily protein [Myxococcota bacterium]
MPASHLLPRSLAPHAHLVALEISFSYDSELTRAEQAVVARAVPQRRAEFATGRKCARLAASALGVPITELLSGPHREPLWPKAVVGSITHCRDVAAAVVCPSRAVAAIGIDIEENEPLPPGTEELVLTERERHRRRVLPTEDRVVFSAKEAVYKCIFPIVERFVDMQEVEIDMTAEACFRARPAQARPAEVGPGLASVPWAKLAGRYAVTETRIWTVAWLPRNEDVVSAR